MSNPPDERNHPSSSEIPAGAVSRRDFLNEIAAAALGVTGLGAAVVTLNYISPNVLF